MIKCQTLDLLHKSVIPEFREAEREISGIQKKTMDSRFRGNDIRENMAKNHLSLLKKNELKPNSVLLQEVYCQILKCVRSINNRLKIVESKLKPIATPR